MPARPRGARRRASEKPRRPSREAKSAQFSGTELRGRPETRVGRGGLFVSARRAFITSRGLGLHRKQAFALHLLAGQLAGAAHGLGLFAGALFGGLFIMTAQLHFAENALALHLLLERLEGLIDIVVANENLHACFLFSKGRLRRAFGARLRTASMGKIFHALDGAPDRWGCDNRIPPPCPDALRRQRQSGGAGLRHFGKTRSPRPACRKALVGSARKAKGDIAV